MDVFPDYSIFSVICAEKIYPTYGKIYGVERLG
jgi:hypothetical protein